MILWFGGLFIGFGIGWIVGGVQVFLEMNKKIDAVVESYRKHQK